jgi:hypothetical protein
MFSDHPNQYRRLERRHLWRTISTSCLPRSTMQSVDRELWVQKEENE